MQFVIYPSLHVDYSFFTPARSQLPSVTIAGHPADYYRLSVVCSGRSVSHCTRPMVVLSEGLRSGLRFPQGVFTLHFAAPTRGFSLSLSVPLSLFLSLPLFSLHHQLSSLLLPPSYFLPYSFSLLLPPSSLIPPPPSILASPSFLIPPTSSHSRS